MCCLNKQTLLNSSDLDLVVVNHKRIFIHCANLCEICSICISGIWLTLSSWAISVTAEKTQHVAYHHHRQRIPGFSSHRLITEKRRTREENRQRGLVWSPTGLMRKCLTATQRKYSEALDIKKIDETRDFWYFNSETDKNVTFSIKYETLLSLGCKQNDSWSLADPTSDHLNKNSRAEEKKSRYECMQRFPNLFIIFYWWKELCRASQCQ